jgi:hypothetical protein
VCGRDGSVSRCVDEMGVSVGGTFYRWTCRRSGSVRDGSVL